MNMFRKSVFMALGLVFSGVAVASDLYYVNDNNQTLNVFNTVTLNSTMIGATGTGGNFGDMAWDRTTNTMYYIGGRGNENLFTLNLTTGAATLVGAYNVSDMFGLAVNASGQLFAQSTANGSNFYTINKVTGVATLQGAGNGVYPGGLTFNTTTGQMLLMQAGGTGDISWIDETTGAATLLASPGGLNDNDFAYDSVLNEYWALDYNGNAFRYDTSFNISNPASGLGNVAAADFANSPVPEPATMAALGLGVAALLRRRKK
jgi:hypothetical protein